MLPDLRKVIFLYVQFHLLDLQQTGLAAKHGQKSSPLPGSQDPSPDFQLKFLSQLVHFLCNLFASSPISAKECYQNCEKQ